MSKLEEPDFFLPERQKLKTIVTPMLKEVINRSLSVHTLSALIVWYGVGRIGKTTTGRYLVDWLNRRFDANNPNSFRGFHYEVGRIKRDQETNGSRASEAFIKQHSEAKWTKDFMAEIRLRYLQDTQFTAYVA